MIREKALILENRRVSPDTVELRLAVSFAGEVKPGQFINIYLNNSARLLPRPLSICRADADAPGSSVPADARRTRFFVFAAALGALWLYFLFTPPA